MPDPMLSLEATYEGGEAGTECCFSHLGWLWEDPALFQQAAELARTLPGLVEQDKQLDIIAGSAGGIASSLNLYAVASSPYIYSRGYYRQQEPVMHFV